MKTPQTIALIGLLAMTLVIGYAFAFGNFSTEGAWITSHPWGIVSLVDLYVGFAIFSMWIAYRENSLGRSLVWIGLMIVLGNWTAALYVLLAVRASGGNWQKFWNGARHA
jgi:hypothetical protein